MAKTPSDKLFRLIRALTPAEKRYFHIYVRGKTGRDSKYLQLFEALDKVEVFDEAAFRKKIYKNQVVEGKKYSELKAYLYHLLLKCLQAYDEDQTVLFKFNHLLQSVAVLFRRGMYDDCAALLAQARKVALQYELFTGLIEVIRWEKQLAYVRMDTDYLHANLERLQYEEDRAHEQLRHFAGAGKSFFQMYTAVKKDAQQRETNRISSLEVLLAGGQEYGEADSHRARVTRYRTQNLFYYAAREHGRFYESGRQMIELLESQPHFLRENLSDYIAALSNLILSCGLLGKYGEVRDCLKKLGELTPITEDDRRKIHRQYYSNAFALGIFTGDFEEARREMQRCREEASAFHSEDYETASFYVQYSCICFGCGDYSGALDYLNRWLNQPRTVEREDLQSMARMLSLILHFEMGNTLLLESLARSTTRFLKKKNRFFALERRFVHLIGDLMKAPGAREQRPAFQKMLLDLQGPALRSEAQALLQTFDFEAWLDSKISGKPFAAAVREKWVSQKKPGE
jgi:tetratricopeptide (TPR) repeat protein